MTTNVKTPCKQCPFMNTCEPGALGGSAPEVYMGQVFVPFVLPCHQHCDFDDPEWRSKMAETPQCAGAAMFRRVSGASRWLPPQLHCLEPVSGLLASPVQFYMHHKQITEEEATAQLIAQPIRDLINIQLGDRSNKPVKF